MTNHTHATLLACCRYRQLWLKYRMKPSCCTARPGPYFTCVRFLCVCMHAVVRHLQKHVVWSGTCRILVQGNGLPQEGVPLQKTILLQERIPLQENATREIPLYRRNQTTRENPSTRERPTTRGNRTTKERILLYRREPHYTRENPSTREIPQQGGIALRRNPITRAAPTTRGSATTERAS